MVTPANTTRASQATRQASPPLARSPKDTGGIASSNRPNLAPQDLQVKAAVTLQADDVRFERSSALEAARPAPDPVTDFLSDRRAELRRSINTEGIAKILNDHRPNLRALRADHHQSISKLIDAIPEEVLRQLANHVGVTDDDYNAGDAAARRAGWEVPVAGHLTSTLPAYVLAPIVLAATEASAIAGLATSLVIAVVIPLFTAIVQSIGAAKQELLRGQSASMALGKPEITELVAPIALRLIEACEKLDSLIREFQSKVEALSTARGHGETPLDPLTYIKELYKALPLEQLAELGTLLVQHDERFAPVCDEFLAMAKTRALVDREEDSRKDQRKDRIVIRGISYVVKQILQLTTNLSRLAIAFSSVGTAGAGAIKQLHDASNGEFDARRKEQKSGLLFVDLYNEIGQRAWDAGEPITAEGIDKAKARSNLYRGPALLRADALVKLGERELAAEVAKHGEIESLPEASSQRKLMQDLERDIANLKSTREDIERPGEIMTRLIKLSEDPSRFRYYWASGTQRIQAGDFQVQYLERLGAMWSTVVASPGMTMIAGQVLNAIYGGSKNVPLAVAVVVTVAVFAIAVISAYMAYTPAVIKAIARNRAKDPEQKMSSLEQAREQITQTILSPLLIPYGDQLEKRATSRLAESMAKQKAVTLPLQALREVLEELDTIRHDLQDDVAANLDAGKEIVRALSEGGTSPKIMPGSPEHPGVGPSSERSISPDSSPLEEPPSSMQLSQVPTTALPRKRA